MHDKRFIWQWMRRLGRDGRGVQTGS
jgi:hypothetical protein